MTTGEKIRKLRIENNMTQEELGVKLGVGKSAVAKYENNRVKNLKKYTIMKLGEIFGVSPDYLYSYLDKPIELEKDLISRVFTLALKHFGSTFEEFAEYAHINPRIAIEFEYDSTNITTFLITMFCDYLGLDLRSFVDYVFSGFHDDDTDEEIINAIEEIYSNTEIRSEYELEYVSIMSGLATLPLSARLEVLKDFELILELKKSKLKE